MTQGTKINLLTWAQAGKIIENDKIELVPICPGTWRALNLEGYWWNGKTAIEAISHYASSMVQS
jgi:hypothetical protein